jgi:rubredoxin
MAWIDAESSFLARIRLSAAHCLTHNLPRFLRKLFPMKTYQCIVCGYVYDEAAGSPSEGIAPGTKWEDVPDSWVCPDCGVGKSDFEMVEI